ncbi:MAG: Hsp20/alpha crystallin family protein [Candidatus Omnitrophica bacterium]|nr:Hsp20/alpha crystallin family protein [Candidatus Omnitrophota bacterium]
MNAITRQGHRWHDPFDLLSDLQEDFGRLFSPALRTSTPEGLKQLVPQLEIHEDENQFTLSIDVPGIDRKDLDISVTGNTLSVKGERSEETQKREKGYYYSERSYGSFQRSVQLPSDVESDKIAANYKDGVLELVIPKSEKSKPKQIKVDVK